MSPKKRAASTTPKDEMQKALAEYGYNLLTSDKNPMRVRRCLPTGIPALDVICCRDTNGVFGLPYGRQIEISGKPDAGKTSTALAIATSAQQQDQFTAWTESELELNEERAIQMGVDVSALPVTTPIYLEQSLYRIKKAVMMLPEYDSEQYDGSTGLVHLYDSVAAISTKAQMVNEEKRKEGEDATDQPALFASKMAKWQRIFKKILVRRDAIVVYTNHVMANIGVTFGKKTISYGGNALKYHCALRVEVTYTGKITTGNDVVGITVNFNIVKNKHGDPFGKIGKVPFIFGHGFEQTECLLLALEHRKMLTKEGLKYRINVDGIDEAITKRKLSNMLQEKPELHSDIMQAIYKS